MLNYVNASNASKYKSAIDGMFRDRKRVFVDILKWDIPVFGSYECDQFDNEDAEYFIITDPSNGRHQASMRVLRTDRPHILDSLFPMLCEGNVPSGPQYRELTRLCLSPVLRARERLQVRNRLFTSLVEYALMTGIEGYTGVAAMNWYQQLLLLGWRCTPLGFPQNVDGDVVAALLAHIEPNTVNLLKAAGTYISGDMHVVEEVAQAA
jgi:N-acyl-L-homoserine lactone synthetase